MTLDLAFIMLGSVAYLGWFSLKSVLCDKGTNGEKCKPSVYADNDEVKVKTIPRRTLMVFVSITKPRTLLGMFKGICQIANINKRGAVIT